MRQLTDEELEQVAGGQTYTVTFENCGCTIDVSGVNSLHEAIQEAELVHPLLHSGN
ncbi:hypothetical protein [Candidatus Poriferisodalis sp.]|uniref:hypothetical protein n=1 Tax=Candidatus Poriferisodalis sp. TaxID=3101277 RepID=UPI003B01A83A